MFLFPPIKLHITGVWRALWCVEIAVLMMAINRHSVLSFVVVVLGEDPLCWHSVESVDLCVEAKLPFLLTCSANTCYPRNKVFTFISSGTHCSSNIRVTHTQVKGLHELNSCVWHCHRGKLWNILNRLKIFPVYKLISLIVNTHLSLIGKLGKVNINLHLSWIYDPPSTAQFQVRAVNKLEN